MVPASTSGIAPLALDSMGFLGSRFARPECVLCTRAGDVFASDRRGGVSHIMPDGDHRIYIGATLDLSGPLHPNGIALDRDGSFLIAHLVDEEGGLWITCILSNRLIRIDVGGTSVTLLDDSDPAHIAEVEVAYQAGRLDRALLDRKSWTKLAHISSIAFAGPELDRAYFGVLLADSLPVVTMPIPGVPPAHWDWR